MFRYLPLLALVMSSPSLAFASSGNGTASSERKIETLVFTGDKCLLTSRAEEDSEKQEAITAILGFVLPLAVEYIFDEVSSGLTKVRTTKSSGSYEFSLYSLEEKTEPVVSGRTPDAPFVVNKLESKLPNCVTVITGKFIDEKSKEIDVKDFSIDVEAEPRNVPEQDRRGDDQLVARLNANGVRAKQVYLAFESKIVAEQDGSAFYYEPVHFKSVSLLPGNGSRKNQGLVYNLSLQGPGTTPWGAVYSSTPIKIGTISKGYELSANGANAAKLQKLKTGKLALPGISQQAFQTFISNEITKLKRPGTNKNLEFGQISNDFVYRYRVDSNSAVGRENCAIQHFFNSTTRKIETIDDRYHCYFTFEDGGSTEVPFDRFDGSDDSKVNTFAEKFTPRESFKIKNFMPVRLHAEIVQTKKPTAAAKVLAHLISKAKPKASGWVSGQFDEDAQFKEGQTRLQTESAYHKAIADLNAYDGTDPDRRRQLELTLERAEAAWQRIQ